MSGLFLVIVVICVVLFFPLATMALWNWLMPLIFGLIKISYLQALGLMVLSSLLFWRESTNKLWRQAMENLTSVMAIIATGKHNE